MPAFGDYSRATSVESDAHVLAGQRGDPDDPEATYLSDVENGDWALWLPHDCGEWIIAHGDPATVLAEGRRFVASVEAALAHIEFASRSGEQPPPTRPGESRTGGGNNEVTAG